MGPVYSLEKMTTKEKLVALEQLWDDLCSKPGDVPSPPWHDEVLSAREAEVKEGKAEFADLAKTKDRVHKACR